MMFLISMTVDSRLLINDFRVVFVDCGGLSQTSVAAVKILYVGTTCMQGYDRKMYFLSMFYGDVKSSNLDKSYS